jgi:hypothetical protein
MVDDAERMLREHGFAQLRVRHHDSIARIELTADQMPRILTDEALRAVVASELTDAGYALAVLDLRGFRSGSLNEVLASSDSPVCAVADDPTGVADMETLAATRHGQILVVEMSNAHITRLADPSLRADFVQQLASAPDVHYVAIQLTNPA